MNYERFVEKIVTKFLLNTCRLRPQLSRPAAQVAVPPSLHLANDEEADFTEHIPLTTGSVAEF